MPRSALLPIGSLVVATALLFLSIGAVAATTKDSSSPAVTNATVNVKNASLTDHSCTNTEWHFVITGLADGQAPASITVMWGNGASQTVALSNFTGGTAHYSTTANLTSTVTGATAQVNGSWNGQFNLSHGPCNGSSGGGSTVVTPSPAPTQATSTPGVVVSPSPTGAVTSTTVNVKTGSLTNHACVATEWGFVITGLAEGQAPASITVMWSNGATMNVSLTEFTGGTAHYTTTANLNSTVTGATAQISGTWSGQFNLSHGPCNVASPSPTSSTPGVVVTPSASPSGTVSASPTVTATATATATATSTTNVATSTPGVATASPVVTTPAATATATARATTPGGTGNTGGSIPSASPAVVGQGQVSTTTTTQTGTQAGTQAGAQGGVARLPSTSTDDGASPALLFIASGLLLMGIAILRKARIAAH